MPTMGALRWMAAGGAVEPGVAEGEDAAVGGHQPVAAAVGGGRHAHDGGVEVDVAGGAVEPGVAEGEDAAVGGHQPVAAAVGGGGHAHDGGVEVDGCRSSRRTGRRRRRRSRRRRPPASSRRRRGLAAIPTMGRVEVGAAHRAEERLGRTRTRRRRWPPSGSRTPGEQGTRSTGLAGLSRVGIDHQRRLVHRLEGAGRHLLELVDQRERPPGVGGAPEVPVGSVVGQDQPVVLHGPQDHLGLGRVARDVEAGLEPEPGPHGRQVGGCSTLPASCRAGQRNDVSVAWAVIADGVGDRARQHLVVAQQSGQDGQPGGVGRRPAGGSEGVRAEVPDGPGVGRGRRPGRSGRCRARRACRWPG